MLHRILGMSFVDAHHVVTSFSIVVVHHVVGVYLVVNVLHIVISVHHGVDITHVASAHFFFVVGICHVICARHAH